MSAKKFKFIPKRCEFCKYYDLFQRYIFGIEVKEATCLNRRFGHSDAEPREYCSEFIPNVSTKKNYLIYKAFKKSRLRA